ncbi:MAG: methyltransferase domain-containing protein [Ruminococcaceae bacterium]|nr:methyltransferase domain-containing protein [Oscillospiraceae bacterium]
MSVTQNIFDNSEFFEGYKKIRDNPLSANEIEEKPALFSLSPDLKGKAVLDLGCGYGENCNEFAQMGAERVLGVDISEKMLNVASVEYPDLTFVRGDMNDLGFITDKYDVVFSSLAVHYIEDFKKFTKQVYDLLGNVGYFIFSQEHPLTTAPVKGVSWSRNEKGEVTHYNLSDYTVSGERHVRWIVDDVKKYHRTFSEIINALLSAGFEIEKCVETLPPEEVLELDESCRKDLHKPNFLVIKAKKSVDEESTENVVLTNMCMVYDDNERAVFIRRTDPDWFGYALPGGHVEKHESLTDACIREIYEETGLTISDLKMCGVKNWIRDNGTRYIVYLYKTNTFSGELRSSEEGKAEWVELKDVFDLPLAEGMDDTMVMFTDDKYTEQFFCKENGKWVENLK